MQPHYLIIHHIRHHSHEHSCCHYNTNNHHENHLINFSKVNHYINPKEPAVIPTVTKNPNSTRSLEPGGSDVNSTANGIIEIQMRIHYCMLWLLRYNRKL